ncbi:UNVERIFIED_CONTAM: hypothetical protein FKN15_007471 [Acipenser sinensis]
MATAASSEEKFSCSVCLDLFTEPATIPCGHSFCLDCIGSYWNQSDQTGCKSLVLKRHALVQPLRDFEQKLCKQHQRLLELYCRTDQSYICALCPHSNHQDHTVILAERERAEKQKELGERQAEIENLIEERLKELERLNQAVESLKNLKPRKLGVYLDYEGGQLSFYNVETRSVIYTFADTFTEKLYPLFSPGLYYSGKNPAPVIICPHTYTD